MSNRFDSKALYEQLNARRSQLSELSTFDLQEASRQNFISVKNLSKRINSHFRVEDNAAILSAANEYCSRINQKGVKPVFMSLQGSNWYKHYLKSEGITKIRGKAKDTDIGVFGHSKEYGPLLYKKSVVHETLESAGQPFIIHTAFRISQQDFDTVTDPKSAADHLFYLYMGRPIGSFSEKKREALAQSLVSRVMNSFEDDALKEFNLQLERHLLITPYGLRERDLSRYKYFKRR